MEIKLENVTKIIKGTTVIDNVSMILHSGIVTGLRGVNGSGKTMLIRLLSGLIKTTKGYVIIDGKILGRDIFFPESIGILIESPAFLDTYSGFENLKLIASIKGRANDLELQSILSEVGLTPNDKKKYKKYSLGMKQRLGIAAAIMEKPSIVLLDEPTNALDTDGIEMLKKLLKKEKERGALIVLSCHDPAIMKELADEIYLLEEGKITGYSPDKGEATEVVKSL